MSVLGKKFCPRKGISRKPERTMSRKTGTKITFHPDPIAAALVEAAADPTIHSEPRLAVLEAVGGGTELDRTQLLSRIGRTLPQRLQVVVAVKLVESLINKILHKDGPVPTL